MSTPSRPSFAVALDTWRNTLHQRGLPSELLWVFDENLVFERQTDRPNDFKLGFQTAFSPPPPDAEKLAYDYFCDFGVRLVFYRIGSAKGKSVCLLLCDKWFEARGEAQGFVRRDDWVISFYPGNAGDIEEITDPQRWRQRLLRDRPLHDLDFCMTLQGIHELLAHDRVLSAYERFALKLFQTWRRLLGRKE